VTTASQIWQLALRAFLRTVRQPGQLFFALVFPLVFLAVVASGLDRAETLPGFPDDSYLDFMLAVPFIHGSLFTAVNAAVELGRDIETGFLNRLALTPARNISLVLGHLAGAVLLGLLQYCVYFGAGLAAGANFEAGWAGVPVLFALAAIGAVAMGAAGTTVALRSGSAEAVQGIFPVFFVLLFLSSMNIPRNLIDADWFRWLATGNPVSYLIEGIRSLVIWGWDEQALLLGFGTGVGLALLFLAATGVAFRQRLTRT
jgi:ABC-2 type transport system permease protein